MDYIDTDSHLAYQQEKEYGGKAKDDFESHFCDWESDYWRDYVEHDVYAYQELLACLGEQGKTLPVDPCELSQVQEDILIELARSQTAWWTKFEQSSYEDFCNRRGEPSDD